MIQPNAAVDLIMSQLSQNSKEATSHTKTKDVLWDELDTKIATTPHDIVYQEDRVKLKHYKPTTDQTLKTPLLIIYALVNRDTMLDLQPARSLVRNLLDEGIDLYMIDWGRPGRKDRYLTIGDHVNGYIDNIVDHIRKQSGADKINIMGMCMGGGFSLMYTALHNEKVKNLITVVTATDFETKDGLLHLWAETLNEDKLVDTFGNLPGDLLNFGFLIMNPARLIDKYVGLMNNKSNRIFVENFIRMEKWIFDTPDVPGETFRQFIKDCYKRNLLIKNKLMLDGQRVDLRKITVPILNIYGKYDRLVPVETCLKTTSAVGSEDKEDLMLDTGHIGIFVSAMCQKQLTPKVYAWLQERDAPSKKEKKLRYKS
jgi:polyhydroxyalkanoate synthase